MTRHRVGMSFRSRISRTSLNGGASLARRSSTRSRLALAAVAGSTLCSVSYAQVEAFRAVALTGTQAAGQPAGVTYSFLGVGSPSLNDSGRVAFGAFLAGPGDPRALFTEGGGSGVATLARVGTPASGQPAGVTHIAIPTSVQAFHLTNAQQTVHWTYLGGPGVTGFSELAMFSTTAGSAPVSIVRSDDPAPGLGAGVNWLPIPNALQVSHAGHVAIHAGLRGTGVTSANDTALFVSTPSLSFSPIAREGAPAPGTPAGVSFGQLSSSLTSPSLRINTSGEVAFAAALQGSTVNATNDVAIFTTAVTGSTTLLAREGAQAPGLPAGVLIGGLLTETVRLSDTGTHVFGTYLTGAGVTSLNNMAVISVGDGGASVVARTGDQAPGTAPGTVVSFVFSAEVNISGQAAYAASLSGPGVNSGNNRAVFSQGAGLGWAMLARHGDQAAGMAPGVTYSFIYEPQISDAGQTAFFSELASPSGVLDAIFATGPLGDVRVVVAEGQMFDVNSDPFISDLRLVTAVSAGFDLNNAGQLVFNASFADGSSGLFVASIPAPASAALLAIGALATTRRRRA